MGHNNIEEKDEFDERIFEKNEKNSKTHEEIGESIQAEALKINKPTITLEDMWEFVDEYNAKIEKEKLEKINCTRHSLERAQILEHLNIYKKQGTSIRESAKLMSQTQSFQEPLAQKFINEFLPTLINNPDTEIHKDSLVEALAGYDTELAYMASYFYTENAIQEVINHLKEKSEYSDSKRLLKQIVIMKENKQTNRQTATMLLRYEFIHENRLTLQAILSNIENKEYLENGFWYPLASILPDYIYTMFTRHIELGLPYKEMKNILKLEF